MRWLRMNLATSSRRFWCYKLWYTRTVFLVVLLWLCVAGVEGDDFQGRESQDMLSCSRDEWCVCTISWGSVGAVMFEDRENLFRS